MNFHKNQFYKSDPTKLVGDKVIPKNSPFEMYQQLLKRNQMNPIEEKPMTPERRLEELRNQNHFIHKNPFQK